MGPSNLAIAAALERVGDLLEAQHADVFRVKAWRAAATTVRQSDRPVAEIATREGRVALARLPLVGPTTAIAIDELSHTGGLRFLDRLEGEVSPEDMFTTVPGIGEGLAHRIHDDLGVDTLEELELAAHDGRLEAIPGFGPRRVQAVKNSLAAMLRRSSRSRVRRIETAGDPAPVPPSVALLLDIDARYRSSAEAGTLPRITPRRFNPEGEAWLPILHEEGAGFRFHVLFSNSALAHRVDRTRDWVVIYWEQDGHEDQCTVVTEYRGPLVGRRVIRGREQQCAQYYVQADA